MTPRIQPRPGICYRVVVTEITDDPDHADDDRDDYIDDVVFDHTGDAFVVGVATVSGNRITAPVDHDGDQFLRERLTVYITNAVLEPRSRSPNAISIPFALRGHLRLRERRTRPTSPSPRGRLTNRIYATDHGWIDTIGQHRGPALAVDQSPDTHRRSEPHKF